MVRSPRYCESRWFHVWRVVGKFWKTIFRTNYTTRKTHSKGEMTSKEGKKSVQERNIVKIKEKEREFDSNM
jgi:hypothetical protein